MLRGTTKRWIPYDIRSDAEEDLKNDPYALRLIKNGLEEFKYKDSNGEEKMMGSMKVF